MIQNFYHKFFARKRFYGLNKTLIVLGLKGMGMMNSTMEENGENWLMKKISESSLGFQTIFDCGAHHGKYSLDLLSVGYNGTIHSFEPNLSSFEIMKSNVREKGDEIVVNNFGLSSKKARVELFDYLESETGSSHSSIYKNAISGFDNKTKSKSQSIELKTLDMYMEENFVKEIDLLKIDTEGNEYEVLLGARKTLSNDKIKMIQFEIGVYEYTFKSVFL